MFKIEKKLNLNNNKYTEYYIINTKQKIKNLEIYGKKNSNLEKFNLNNHKVKLYINNKNLCILKK